MNWGWTGNGVDNRGLSPWRNQRSSLTYPNQQRWVRDASNVPPCHIQHSNGGTVDGWSRAEGSFVVIRYEVFKMVFSRPSFSKVDTQYFFYIWYNYLFTYQSIKPVDVCFRLNYFICLLNNHARFGFTYRFCGDCRPIDASFDFFGFRFIYRQFKLAAEKTSPQHSFRQQSIRLQSQTTLPRHKQH